MLPVALFAFNRLWHVQQTVQSLLKNVLVDEVHLTVYCDGPRSESDHPLVQAVRAYVKNIQGVASLTIVEYNANQGLAHSIIAGVTEQCVQFGRVIVLEDDLYLSPYFLTYMKNALTHYQDEEKVISIHGYCYPVHQSLPETFFLKGADCWGWATWQRGWDLFEPDGNVLLQQLKKRSLSKAFNMSNSTNYMKMLQDQVLGRNNSWAIRWRASAFLQDKLTLYPGRSLVNNIGHDNSGTHCAVNHIYDITLASQPVTIHNIPIVENTSAHAAYVRFYRNVDKNIVGKKMILIGYVKKIIKGCLPMAIYQYYLRYIRKSWFQGSYQSWQEASENIQGYSAPEIIDHIYHANVKASQTNCFERDGMLFKNPQYRYPILAYLQQLMISKGCLTVLDIGGSFGTSYRNFRHFCPQGNVSWHIVEQEKFSLQGRDFFENKELKFENDLMGFLTQKTPDIILLSSTLQYIEKPEELLVALNASRASRIVFDRTPFVLGSKKYLTIQNVKTPYCAKYPAWLFPEHWIQQYLTAYQKVDTFHCDEGTVLSGNYTITFKGFCFEKIK